VCTQLCNDGDYHYAINTIDRSKTYDDYINVKVRARLRALATLFVHFVMGSHRAVLLGHGRANRRARGTLMVLGETPEHGTCHMRDFTGHVRGNRSEDQGIGTEGSRAVLLAILPCRPSSIAKLRSLLSSWLLTCDPKYRKTRAPSAQASNAWWSPT
jgi:hypothetical protein